MHDEPVAAEIRFAAGNARVNAVARNSACATPGVHPGSAPGQTLQKRLPQMSDDIAQEPHWRLAVMLASREMGVCGTICALKLSWPETLTGGGPPTKREFQPANIY
jgi:hypothetical protein